MQLFLYKIIIWWFFIVVVVVVDVDVYRRLISRFSFSSSSYFSLRCISCICRFVTQLNSPHFIIYCRCCVALLVVIVRSSSFSHKVIVLLVISGYKDWRVASERDAVATFRCWKADIYFTDTFDDDFDEKNEQFLVFLVLLLLLLSWSLLFLDADMTLWSTKRKKKQEKQT